MGFAAESNQDALLETSNAAINTETMSVIDGAVSRVLVLSENFGCSVAALFESGKPGKGRISVSAVGSSADEAVGILAREMWPQLSKLPEPDCSNSELGARVFSSSTLGDKAVRIEYINVTEMA